MSNFGTRLKLVRKEKGITQRQLSSMLGIAQSTIANYENNTRFPGETILKDISEYLETSIDFLMGMEAEKQMEEDKLVESVEFNYEELVNLLIAGKSREAKEMTKRIHQGSNLLEIISELFLPSLKLLGSLWENGKITVAQEHYSTGIISSLVEHLSEVENKPAVKNFTAMFMTPGEESHTLSLRMAAEYFRSSGWKIIFLGRSVPFNDLEEAIIKNRVNLLVLSIFTTENLNTSGYLIEALKKNPSFKNLQIMIGGRGVKSKEEAVNTGADYYSERIQEIPLIIEKIESDNA